MPTTILPILLFLASSLFNTFSNARPASALEVPALSGRIVDLARLLPADVAQSLDREMAEHEKRTGNQVAVLTIPSLEGESLEEYSHRVATTWKLGGKGVDNGVLLLVVPGERRIRIEVGYGLEGTLTDAVSSQIIRREMVPKFRTGDVPGGISSGVRAIVGTIEGTYTAPEKAKSRGDDNSGVFWIAVLIGALIGGPLLGGRLKMLGGIVSAMLSFVIALPTGLKLALLAGLCGMVAALLLAGMFGAGGFSGSGGRRRGRPGGDVGWGPALGGGGWSSNDSFSGGGGDFGGGGASGRW
jgi:uncharacterized protein